MAEAERKRLNQIATDERNKLAKEAEELRYQLLEQAALEKE
jgi:hypothetical protein